MNSVTTYPCDNLPRSPLHVAADEKTYLKSRCTPFPGNMSFNPETIAKQLQFLPFINIGVNHLCISIDFVLNKTLTKKDEIFLFTRMPCDH